MATLVPPKPKPPLDPLAVLSANPWVAQGQTQVPVPAPAQTPPAATPPAAAATTPGTTPPTLPGAPPPTGGPSNPYTAAPPTPPAAPPPTPAPPKQKNLYGYARLSDMTRDEADQAFRQTDIGREGNPRFMSREEGIEKYGSQDAWTTAITRFDQAYNAAMNGSGSNYTGGQGGGTLFRDEWEALEAANAGSGAGGGGGSGTGGGGGTVGGPSDAVSALIARLLAGQEGPYDAKSIAAMKSAAYDESAGGVEAAKRDAALRNRRSGNLYGAAAGSAALDIEKAGRSDFAGASRDIGMKAVEANFGAKMQGLQAGLEQLKGERDERMANARNAVEREAIKSQYKGLMDSTRAKIEAEARIAQQGYDAERASGAAGRDFQREMSAAEWERELNRRAYEEPFRIAGYAP